MPSDESLTVRIRYKLPDGDKSQELERGVVDEGQDLSLASDDFRLAAAVAEFGMLLRGSPHKGQPTYAALLELSEPLCARDPEGYRPANSSTWSARRRPWRADDRDCRGGSAERNPPEEGPSGGLRPGCPTPHGHGMVG